MTTTDIDRGDIAITARQQAEVAFLTEIYETRCDQARLDRDSATEQLGTLALADAPLPELWEAWLTRQQLDEECEALDQFTRPRLDELDPIRNQFGSQQQRLPRCRALFTELSFEAWLTGVARQRALRQREARLDALRSYRASHLDAAEQAALTQGEPS